MAKKRKIFRLPKLRIRRFYLAFYLINIAIFLGVMLFTVLVIFPQIAKTTKKYITQNIKYQIDNQANSIQVNINNAVNLINNLNSTFSKYQQIPAKNRRNYYSQYLDQVIQSHNELLSIFTLWKPYSIDKLDDRYRNPNEGITGQFGKWIIRNGEIINDLQLTPQDFSLIYDYTKILSRLSRQSFYIQAPIKEYSVVYGDTIIYARFISPVRDTSGVIQGIIGFDLPIDYFLQNLKPSDLKNTYITNKEQIFIFHPEPTFIGLKLTTVYPELINDPLVDNLYREEQYIGVGKYFDKLSYVFLRPLKITTDITWNLIKTYPPSTFTVLYKKMLTFVSIITILFIGVLTLMFIGLRAIFTRQFKNYEKLLQGIYTGNPRITLKSKLFKYKEFSNIENLITRTISKLQEQIKFTENLIKGNYDIEPLPETSEEDYLSISLNRLAEKLKETQKEQERLRKEQELDTWKNTGLAKFNDLLRQHINDLETLAYETISELTEYLGAVVGAFFLYVEEPGSQYLELIGYYGYNRKIYEKKRIELGEGLAGTVALERKPIITKVPEDYVELATGLGKAKPNYIAVYPLIATDYLYGVIEIAKIDKFEQHHLDFLNEISVVIASTLASAKVASETRRLLEESRHATEQMNLKEKQLEETIKKIEKLRKESEEQRLKLESIVNALNEIVYYAEFSPTQKVLAVNRQLLNLLNISYAEATAKNYFDLFQIPVTELDKHKEYWEQISRGHKVKMEMTLELEDKTYWVNAVLVPVLKEMQLDRVLFIGIDLTEVKEKEQAIERSLIQIKEKEEQIRVQEMQLQVTMQELEELYKENEEKDRKIRELTQKLDELRTMHDTLAKEFEKRVKRSRKIEAAMREKIRLLEEELEKCRKQNS